MLPGERPGDQHTIEVIHHAFSYVTYVPEPRLREGLEDLKVTYPSDSREAQCNLTALIGFMQKSGFGVERIRAARKNKCSPGDVRNAFEAYCRGLESVEYGYGDFASLFDKLAGRHEPDCRGRAKGFLQILAVCGVDLDKLALVSLGGDAEEQDIKVVARDDAAAQSFSPNSVKASLGMGATAVTVSRTRREPFANHYCAKVSHGGVEYWDPLFQRCYVNGMKDYFQTLKEEPSFRLPFHGPKCYVDMDDQNKRLYLFKPDHVLRPVAAAEAYSQVLTAKRKLDSVNEGVYLIIDGNDWGNTRAGEKHPAILKHVFKPVHFTETLKG